MSTIKPVHEDESRNFSHRDAVLGAPLLNADVGGKKLKKNTKSSRFNIFRQFPSSIKFLVWNEFCERFSYYGMRTILALFLLEHLGLSETKSTEIVHLFIVACYATPVLGALLSDGFLGKYSTVLYLSFLYSLGNWVMSLAAIPARNEAPLFALLGTILALFLIALGTGGIKPCLAAFGGDQIEWSMPDGEVKDRLRTQFFSLYYFAINAGSFVSTLLTPILRADASYAVAFAVPAVLMLCALFVFWMGRRTYIDRPPEGNVFPVVGRVIVDAIKLRKAASRDNDDAVCEEGQGRSPSKCKHWLDAAKFNHAEEDVEDVKALLRVLIVLLPAPLFWCLFDQQSSKWVFQAREMDGRVDWLGGLVIQPDQMQALNPVLILMLIPLFDQVIYPVFQKCGSFARPLNRMLIGMLLGALAFLISGLLQLAIDNKARANSSFIASGIAAINSETLAPLTGGIVKPISMLWQVPQYVVVTSGEILFSITGLEFAYSQAPHTMKSVVQSVWLLTVAAGNLATVVIVAIIGDRLSKANQFFLFSGGCVLAMLLMAWIGSNFKYRCQLTSIHLEQSVDSEVTIT